MRVAAPAEDRVKDGDPAGALVLLQQEVRAKPADPKLRVFLFQLLCVLGQWDRALNQLKVAAELDPAAIAMQQTYGDAVQCEAVRAGVFAGTKVPMIFGEPDPWLALLVESRLAAGRGEKEQAEQLRARAFEDAPPSPGTINGQPFAWIADADPRLGPVLEVVINGRYYWVPFARLRQIDVEPPEDLRDVVWTPAHLEFANGGESVALIPTRYPGSEQSADGTVALARRTVWQEVAPEVHWGLGQRVFATDVDEVPIMDLRRITIGDEAAPDAVPGA
jgi:type VI secretion system protein ImpE